MSLPHILLAGGGHARVVLEVLRAQGKSVLGVTERDPAGFAGLPGLECLGDDQAILSRPPDSVLLVNGVGSTRSRRKLFEDFKARGYRFATLVHPSAVVSDSATLGEGAQVMAGAVVQAGAMVGDNAIVNTRACVDHDCRIGAHVHLAPGTVLSGNVTIGDGAHLGTASVVIQGIHIGEDALVAAGAVVLRDVRGAATVMGVPARETSR